MGVPTRTSQNFVMFCCVLEAKMQQSKDFKLEILIYLNLPIIERWNPLHQTSHTFHIP